MTENILFIDDEKNILSAIQRQLRNDFNVVTVASGDEALAAVKSDGPFAVAVCDMRMPGMDGIATLNQIAKESPETVRMMLTAAADQETAVEAINQGQIFCFLNKPCPEELLRTALKRALRQYELVTAEKTLLQHTLAGSVKVLMDVLSLVDPTAFGQATRIRDWSRQVAQKLELESTWDLDMAAAFAFLGLVAVPPDILEKQRRGKQLSSAEQGVFDAAPGTGHRLLSNIPRLNDVADVVYYQNKAFSGDGYPFDDDKAGEDIPYGARILKILTDLSELTSGSRPTAIEVVELQNQADQYDPKILEAVIELWGSESDEVAADEVVAGAHHKVGGLPERIVEKEVRIDLLMPGDRLLSAVHLENGNLLLSAGNTVTNAQIERMRNLQKLTEIVEPIKIARDLNAINTDASWLE
jgi:response regulator RpfG family c-di-GMP phosphodiesterase